MNEDVIEKVKEDLIETILVLRVREIKKESDRREGTATPIGKERRALRRRVSLQKMQVPSFNNALLQNDDCCYFLTVKLGENTHAYQVVRVAFNCFLLRSHSYDLSPCKTRKFAKQQQQHYY